MSTRDASRPAAGAGRDAVRTALAVLLGAGLAYVLPEGTTMEVRGAAALVTLAIVSPFLAALGKWLRSQGIEGWPFVFVLALLVGCAAESSKINWAWADAGAETLSGPSITVTDPEQGTTSFCTGGCKWRRAVSRGFSVPFTGVLGRLVEGAAAFVGASPPQAPQAIEVSVEGVTVVPSPESE